MCFALFLAADGDLPCTGRGDPPVFAVEPADPGGDGVARHLPQATCIRRLGAMTGCSCGFQDDDGAGSRHALVAYLQALPADRRVWLYGCWEGEWDEPVQERRSATTGDLLLPDAFVERQVIFLDRESST